jgi:hypothetical protein
MMKAMKAKFSGRCSACGRAIARGADILWSRETGAVHPECAGLLEARLAQEQARKQEVEREKALALDLAGRLADQLGDKGVRIFAHPPRGATVPGMVELSREELVRHMADLLRADALEVVALTGVDRETAIRIAAESASEALGIIAIPSFHIARLRDSFAVSTSIYLGRTEVVDGKLVRH